MLSDALELDEEKTASKTIDAQKEDKSNNGHTSVSTKGVQPPMPQEIAAASKLPGMLAPKASKTPAADAISIRKAAIVQWLKDKYEDDTIVTVITTSCPIKASQPIYILHE